MVYASAARERTVKNVFKLFPNETLLAIILVLIFFYLLAWCYS